MEVLYTIIALALFFLGFIAYEYRKSGEYRVRMNTTIGETPLVRGQVRKARYKTISGWQVKFIEDDGSITGATVWHPVSRSGIKDLARLDK